MKEEQIYMGGSKNANNFVKNKMLKKELQSIKSKAYFIPTFMKNFSITIPILLYKFLNEDEVGYIVDPQPASSNWEQKPKDWEHFVKKREWKHFLNKWNQVLWPTYVEQ